MPLHSTPLQSDGQLLIRHGSGPAFAGFAASAPAAGAGYAIRPLFAPTQTHAMAAASAAPVWSLATPPTVTQMAPWDAAHHAAAQDGYASYVEPNVMIGPAGLANNPAGEGLNQHYPPTAAVAFSPAWHLTQDYAGFENIRGLAAGAGIRIAHLDTGYTPAHSSTPRRLRRDLGWNFVDDNNDTTDPGTQFLDLLQPGHGTATLALLAGGAMALNFNGQAYHGDIGGAPDADIVPVRIGASVIHIASAAMAQGLLYALAPNGDAANRCDVLSISHGGLPSAAWADAVNQLYEAGVVVVAASGDNLQLGLIDLATQFTVYPSAFNRVITALGATFDAAPYRTDATGVLQGSWGPAAVMEKAIAGFTPNVPWMDFKRLPDGFDMNGGGTSASTPQIAAACALWLQLYGSQLPADWRRVEACRVALLESATPTTFGRPLLGWGTLNVPALLDAAKSAGVIARANGAAPALAQSAHDDANFAFWRLLVGNAPDGSAQEKMYEIECAQVMLSSADPTLIVAAQAAAARQPLNPAQLQTAITALGTQTLSVALRARLATLAPAGIAPRTPAAFGMVAAASASAASLAPSATDHILTWEDDPLPAVMVNRPIPDLSLGPAFAITTPAPPAGVYPLGSAAFRYWVAAEALRRGGDFWAPLLPAAGWQPGPTLNVILDAGVDLNAYYDRAALNFFHGAAGAAGTVYSAESPDVVCHELGHAVLDALKPALWNAGSHEAAAFHEAFGDISALLSALQLPSLRAAILRDTAGRLANASRLSRLAEQLGAAIRLSQPDAVDADCLRNAANSFTYDDPISLPQYAPATQISAEAHSFSRVFTGAFLDIFGAVLSVAAADPAAPSSDEVLTVAAELADILVRGVQQAPVVPNFYAQVAAAMVQASSDVNLAYPAVLKAVFIRRAILSVASASAMHQMQSAAPDAAAAASLAQVAVPAGDYGLAAPVLMHFASHSRSYVAQSAASRGNGAQEPVSAVVAARGFLDDLFSMGRIDYGAFRDPLHHPDHVHRLRTHRLVADNGAARLERCLFDCGFGR